MNQVVISELNRTPIVQIVTWFTLVTSLLAFFTHAGIKFYVFRSLTVETWFVLTSLIFCIAQSIAVSLQTRYGFGTPIAMLSVYEIEANLKCEYAAMILLIVSLGFSKLAIIAFVHHLTPSVIHRRINFGVLLMVFLWLVCSIFLAAFECRVPRPWDRKLGQCLDRSIWWTAVSVSNIVTEVAIVALELGITAQLQVRRQRKAAVMSLFAFRLLVLVAAAAQLYFFQRESKDEDHKDDLTLGYWRSSICSQTLQCLAIVTTCLPYTKLFMEGFESGLMRLDDLRRRGEHTSKDDSKGYKLMDISRSGQSGQSGPSRRFDNESETSIQILRSWNVQVDTAGWKSKSTILQ